MKTKLGVLIVLITATIASAQTTNLTALLQQGLFEEQANRNLDAAIADYQTLAAQFDKDRQLAATAVFRLGECYRMQGKTNEAALEYQRILHDFSDQTQLATLSRQDLTGMGIQSAQVASTGLAQQMELLSKRLALTEQDLADTQRLAQLGTKSQADVRAAEREVLQLQQQLAALGATGAQGSEPEISDAKLWNTVKDLPPAELRKVLPTLMPDEMLTSLLQKLNIAEENLAVITNDYASNNLAVVRLKADLDTLNHQIIDQIDGMMQALKMRAELAQPTVAASPPTDAEDQEIQRIKEMIQNSPDLINAPEDHGHTLLENAAINGSLKVAAFLLDHGADVNAGKFSALNLAANAGNRAMVEFLLSHGADINTKAWTGETPLHTAASEGYQLVTKTLLANKADVNAQDDYGATPLLEAARNGHWDTVQILLDAGANPNLPDREGRTPLSFAAESGSP